MQLRPLEESSAEAKRRLGLLPRVACRYSFHFKLGCEPPVTRNRVRDLGTSQSSLLISGLNPLTLTDCSG
ncbi:hypothetical protein D3C71_1143360 [compost metagenome]